MRLDFPRISGELVAGAFGLHTRYEELVFSCGISGISWLRRSVGGWSAAARY